MLRRPTAQMLSGVLKRLKAQMLLAQQRFAVRGLEMASIAEPGVAGWARFRPMGLPYDPYIYMISAHIKTA